MTEAREAFKGPFTVGNYGVIRDANNVQVARMSNYESAAQWLCDRLNSPAHAIDAKAAAEEIGRFARRCSFDMTDQMWRDEVVRIIAAHSRPVGLTDSERCDVAAGEAILGVGYGLGLDLTRSLLAIITRLSASTATAPYRSTEQRIEDANRSAAPQRGRLRVADSIDPRVNENSATCDFRTGPSRADLIAASDLLRASQGDGLSPAARDIVAERRRQVEVEGWTAEHDEEHDGGELAIAGACYAMRSDRVGGGHDIPKQWPWDRKWWKPKDKRRDLVRAAALILAEIERLDRKATLPPAPSSTGGAGEKV